MNFAMWGKALRIIPSVTKEEWGKLDIVSRWLIASRAAVLVMTFLSAALAGLFALRAGSFHVLPWLALTLGLVLAHATNNIFNDFTDFVRGVDVDNYYRTMYGPQPLVAGLMTKRQHLRWAGLTGLSALCFGLALIIWRGFDLNILILIAVGAFFVLAYTWPLKKVALGEISVLAVWGPLMIGGGYYTLTGSWDWNVVFAGLPYALGVTTVIFGKHIDKTEIDRVKGIRTLPVIIGERAGRWMVIGMTILPYLLLIALVATHYFSPLIALTVLALPSTMRTLQLFRSPRPTSRPEWLAEGGGGWPLYFAPIAFVHNRIFGFWFLVGLVLDVALRIVPATSSLWR